MTTVSWIAVYCVIGAAVVLAAVLLVRWLRRDRLIDRAFRQAAEGDMDGAVALLKDGIAEDDPQGVRLEALAFLYFQRLRWAEAAGAFAEAAERKPQSIVRRVYQAHAMARAGKLDEAKALLEAVAGERPYDVCPICGLALVLAEAGDLAAAAERYWKARQLFQDHPQQQTAEGMGLLEECATTISRSVSLEAQPQTDAAASPH